MRSIISISAFVFSLIISATVMAERLTLATHVVTDEKSTLYPLRYEEEDGYFDISEGVKCKMPSGYENVSMMINFSGDIKKVNGDLTVILLTGDEKLTLNKIETKKVVVLLSGNAEVSVKRIIADEVLVGISEDGKIKAESLFVNGVTVVNKKDGTGQEKFGTVTFDPPSDPSLSPSSQDDGTSVPTQKNDPEASPDSGKKKGDKITVIDYDSGGEDIERIEGRYTVEEGVVKPCGPDPEGFAFALKISHPELLLSRPAIQRVKLYYFKTKEDLLTFVAEAGPGGIKY